MFEVGEDQAETVMELMKEADFGRVKSILDTAGTPRVVTGELL
jgi:methylase of polypeptide subunit release factors